MGNGFKKYLFSFIRPDFKEESIKEINDIGVEVLHTEKRKKVIDPGNIPGILGNGSIFKSLYYSDKTLSYIISLIKRYEIDIVHFESFYTGFFISSKISELGVKQIFGTENIEHKIYEDYAKNAQFLLRPVFFNQVKKIKREEEKMFESADLCLAVTDYEADVIRKNTSECEVIRNGVDLDRFNYKKASENVKNLLFVGNFSYFPNIDAINFFTDEIFSKLDTSVKLTIIGKKVSNLKIKFSENIEKIEFIPDILDAYHNAGIMVAPIRMGGGTNFKILEAMAAGLPIVALPERLVGLDIENGKNIMIAKNAEEFKKHIEILMVDEKLRNKISKNARDLVEKEYSWRIIGNNLATIWKNL